ncbi:MMPL family transporter [Vulcanisaeta thermophila]|uniref:MMPL family transporter n=1 Tax=Vulcanisaeta thermophila TaxID=867917 RepID=UPI000853820C|nr:MMPL family transporter [Vulcanisaeta thermophila]
MERRRLLSIIIVITWALAMASLAYLSPRIFSALTYNEGDLMPSYVEPVVVNNIVDKYLGRPNETTVIIVVGINPNNEEELINRVNYVVNIINETAGGNTSINDIVKVYNHVYEVYNNTVDRWINNEISNITPSVMALYRNITEQCNEAISLNREIYSKFNDVARTVSTQYMETLRYAQLLYGKIASQVKYPSINVTQLFRETTEEYVAMYGSSEFINRIANQTEKQIISEVGLNPTPYQLAKLNMTGILLNNYLELINEEFPGVNPLNTTTLLNYVIKTTNSDADPELTELALLMGPQGDMAVLKSFIYQEFLNKTPVLVRPYLNYLICTNDSSVDLVLSLVKNELLDLASQEYEPPSIFNLPNNLTNYFINNTYTVVIATVPGNYEDTIYSRLVSLSYVYPVSTGIILYEFDKITTSDVNIIDKVTAVSVFITMLAMLGTLMGPVTSLTTLGLTYLASLGLLYLWAVRFKLYYLTIYMIAPVIFGIGVDYSMLMLSRYFEERIRGKDPIEALNVIKRVVRPTVLASASVVGLGLGSFVISRFYYIDDVGLGFIVSVVFTALTTAFILPELINLLRDRVLWPMGLRAKSLELRSTLLADMAKFAVRRPKLVIALFLLATMMSLTYLILNIKLTTDPVQVMPNTPSKFGLSILTKFFSDYVYSTAYLVVYGNETAALALTQSLNNQSYVLSTYMAYNGSSLYIIKAVINQQSLSDRLIPIYLSLRSLTDNVGRAYNATVLIGGSPADKYFVVVGFEKEYYGLIIYVMIAINIVILTIYMRSLMIPLRLVSTVLMSITWSLALTVAVFQGLMGIKTYWLLPIILISLLLSVGTDYDLFIISRFKEELARGYDDAEAIVRAVEFTGPVVTGAALVLAMAFASLALSSLFLLKQIALAIASSVLIDSFLVRPLLVPAIIVLLGRYNWWPFSTSRSPGRNQ